MILYQINKIYEINIDELKIYHKNCKKHNKKNIDAIKKSVELFNQYKPLIVSLKTKEILVGNGTYQALKELNYKKVFVIFVDFTDEKEKALNLLDNKLSTLSTWNNNLLQKIQNFDEDFLNIVDFDEDFLNKLIKSSTRGTIEKQFNPIITEDNNKFIKQEIQFIKCPCCGKEFQKQ